MFNDLDLPLNASRGLSATAGFLVKVMRCHHHRHRHYYYYNIFMRPSSLGGGRILRRTLSVCLSVRLSVRPSR